MPECLNRASNLTFLKMDARLRGNRHELLAHIGHENVRGISKVPSPQGERVRVRVIFGSMTNIVTLFTRQDSILRYLPDRRTA